MNEIYTSGEFAAGTAERDTQSDQRTNDHAQAGNETSKQLGRGRRALIPAFCLTLALGMAVGFTGGALLWKSDGTDPCDGPLEGRTVGTARTSSTRTFIIQFTNACELPIVIDQSDFELEWTTGECSEVDVFDLSSDPLKLPSGRSSSVSFTVRSHSSCIGFVAAERWHYRYRTDDSVTWVKSPDELVAR